MSVWWDFENCNLPAGANVFRVAHSITAAVRACGIKGPIQITAFGDILQLSRSNQEALSSTGINLTHIPHGGKNSADRSLLVDLMYWVSQNPPPAHLFLISGDRDFASILHRLRMNNYNILLASPESAPGVLCSAASIMWQWNALVRGENLIGKHFNQPPDGPYGSWYGHYRVSLEDPFSLIEQAASPRAEESCESNSDVKPRPVPKLVMRQIRQIVNSCPKGVSITELRAELFKSNVSIDKDLYGYKKFSRFLLSMPHILKLQAEGDGQFVVRNIAPKVPEPVDSSPGKSAMPVSNDGDNFTKSSKLDGEERSITKTAGGKSSLPPSPQVNVEESPTKVEELPPLDKNVEKTSNVHISTGHLPLAEAQVSPSEVGLFQRIWTKWFSGGDDDSAKRTHCIPYECSTPGNSSEKTKSEEATLKSSQSADPVASLSSHSKESILEDKTAKSSEAYSDKSSTSSGFFRQIINWCDKFWNGGLGLDISSDQSNERLNMIDGHSGKHEIFSTELFWNDMESFIHSPKGSGLVSQSKTRLQMGQNLQKEGPLAIRSLKESDLLHLVDLLVSNKKWVEESPSLASPFRLSRPISKTSGLSHPHGSNGLRSIFLATSPQSEVQRLQEDDNRDKKYQNVPHTGVSLPVSNKKLSERTKSEILADCQKLVEECLKEHPQGFNMGSFRKRFIDRYGYPLDIQKLGYQKLASLLQNIPGVQVESTYIIPSWKVASSSSLETTIPNIQENAINSRSELMDASRKDDHFNSPWEELGPVAGKTADRKEMESRSTKDVEGETRRQTHHTYEPSLSDDDDLSDSDGDSPSLTRSEQHGKPKLNEEDSSLLHILDSWYGSKEDNNRRDRSEHVNDSVDCSKNLGSSGTGIKNENLAGNNGRKQRPVRSYNFVSESGGENKDKLIDGILGSLKKSGDSRMQT